MKNFKKYILAVALLCVCLLFAGCSGGGALYSIVNADGSYVEYYTIPFSAQELSSAGATNEQISEVKTKIRILMNTQFNNYLEAYRVKVNFLDAPSEYKDMLKDGVTIADSFTSKLVIPAGCDENSIIYAIIYDNDDCFNFFKQANDDLSQPKEIVVEKGVFTTTTKVVRDPVFEKAITHTLTVGQSCVKLAENVMIDVFKTDWPEVSAKLNFEAKKNIFSYAYVVPTARLHSNADKVLRDGGYSYHFWTVDVSKENPIKVETWTVSANRIVWYIIALLGATIIIGAVYLKGTLNDRKVQKAQQEKLDKQTPEI